MPAAPEGRPTRRDAKQQAAAKGGGDGLQRMPPHLMDGLVSEVFELAYAALDAPPRRMHAFLEGVFGHRCEQACFVSQMRRPPDGIDEPMGSRGGNGFA